MDPLLVGLIGSIVTGLIAMVPSLVTALAALRKANETHSLVNSRMTEILALAKELSLAQGRVEGAERQKEVALLEDARVAAAVQAAQSTSAPAQEKAAPIAVEQPLDVRIVEEKEKGT